nr:hypothetical protein [Helicobacter apodemus]
MIYANFGSKVTLLQRKETFLRKKIKILQNLFMRVFSKRVLKSSVVWNL